MNKPISEAVPSKQYSTVIQARKKRNILVTTGSTLPKDEVEIASVNSTYWKDLEGQGNGF